MLFVLLKLFIFEKILLFWIFIVCWILLPWNKVVVVVDEPLFREPNNDDDWLLLEFVALLLNKVWLVGVLFWEKSVFELFWLELDFCPNNEKLLFPNKELLLL